MNYDQYQHRPSEIYGQQYMAWPNQMNHRTRPIVTSHFQHQHHQHALHPPPQFIAAKQTFNKIKQVHLTHYLFDDDNVLAHRSKLEHLIDEYLSLVPQDDKFQFKSTLDCLKCTLERSTFNPKKAITAFNAIEHYAKNLLNSPWREEFKKIYAYNGFFFSTIDSVLEKYDRIMDQMGFQFNRDDCVFTLKDSVFEPETVSEVSLDCLIATVLIKQIMHIHEQVPSASYRKIFRVLEQTICDTDNAIEILKLAEKPNLQRLIDFDSPDSTAHRRTKLSLNDSPIRDHIIPPPSDYLENDLDNIEYIDNSPEGSSVKQSTSYPKFPKPSSSKSSPKVQSKSKQFNIDARLAQELENLDLKQSPTDRNKQRQFTVYPKKKITMNEQRLRISNNRSPITTPQKITTTKAEQWTCKACSMKNDPSSETCSCCYKSRRYADEEVHLESGGKYCSACTLVNSKNSTQCRICKASLIDAGTYI